MLKKRLKPQPIGVNADLPEGIFGDTSLDWDNPLRRRIRPKNRSTHVGREMFGYSIELTPPIPLKKKSKLKSKLKISNPLGTKTKTKKVRHIELVAPKKKKRKAAAMLPNFDINYDSVLPKEARGLQMQNVVQMTEAVLKSIIKNTETKTTELSNLLLQSVAPSVLSFDAASSYVKAVLSSGLKIETEIDRGVAEAVESLGRIEVINHFVDRMALAPAMKQRLLEKFIDGLADQAILTMLKASKSTEMSGMIRELDAVLVKRSERQKQDRDNAERQKRRGPTPADDSPQTLSEPSGIQRSRRDTPRSGGF